MINSRDSDVELSREQLRRFAYDSQALNAVRRYEIFGGGTGKSEYIAIKASLENGMLAVKTEQRRKDAIETCIRYNITIPTIYVLETDKTYERGQYE